MRKIVFFIITLSCLQLVSAFEFYSPALRGVGKNLVTFFPDRVVDNYYFPHNFVKDNNINSYHSYLQIWEGSQISYFKSRIFENFKYGLFININYENNDHYFPYENDGHWIDAFGSNNSWDDESSEYSTSIDDNGTAQTDDNLIITENKDGLFYEKYYNTGLIYNMKFLISKPEYWNYTYFIDLGITKSYDPKDGMHYARYFRTIEPVEDNLDYMYDYNETITTRLSDCERTSYDLTFGNSVMYLFGLKEYSMNFSLSFYYLTNKTLYYDSIERITIKRFQSNNLNYSYDQEKFDFNYESYGIGNKLQILKEKQYKYVKSITSYFFEINGFNSKKNKRAEFRELAFGLSKGYYIDLYSFLEAAIGVKGEMEMFKGYKENITHYTTYQYDEGDIGKNTNFNSGSIIFPVGLNFILSQKIEISLGWAYHYFSCHDYDWDGYDYNTGINLKIKDYEVNFAVNKEKAFSKPLFSISLEKQFR